MYRAINKSFTNNILDTESTNVYEKVKYKQHKMKKQANKQHGGAFITELGGFPPIFKCEDIPENELNIIQNENINTNTREFTKVNNAVSIKDIISKQQTLSPFISI